LLEWLPRLEHSLQERGYIAFDAYVDQRRAERNGNSNQQSQQPAAVSPPPIKGRGNNQLQELTFQASQLVATVNDSKTYWKVKGGKFTKYGVTIWPDGPNAGL
jgi:hypothetical protein